MKRKIAQSNSIAEDFPSLRNLESLCTAALVAGQWREEGEVQVVESASHLLPVTWAHFANLYDLLKMPTVLLAAYQRLDLAVDA